MPPKKAAKKAAPRRAPKAMIVPIPKKGQKGRGWFDDLSRGFKAGATLGLSEL